MGRNTATARALDEARETLAAWALRVAAANKRMVELERELAPMRERLSHQQNEILSLKRSLGLSASENSRLSERLSQGAAAAEKASARLDRTRSALAAAKNERDDVARTSHEQIAALNAQMEAMSARAATAEKAASEMQRNLLTCSAENSRAQRQIASMETSLKEKNLQVQAFKRAQSNLTEGIKSRDAALARAEERIRRLAELFLELEAKASRATSDNLTRHIESSLSGEPQKRSELDAFGKAAGASCAILRRDLENDGWLFGGREIFRAA
jgi:chromosome segregation ATPase